jgi:hypothetical protein
MMHTSPDAIGNDCRYVGGFWPVFIPVRDEDKPLSRDRQSVLAAMDVSPCQTLAGTCAGAER